MLSSMTRWLARLAPATMLVLSACLVLLTGALDYHTGYELTFSIFYVAPIALAAWYLGRRSGLLICGLSAATWLSSDRLSGHVHLHLWVAVWNTGVRMGFFVIIAVLLARLRAALEQHRIMAEQDGLTGLLNARAFRQRCRSVFELAARHTQPLALGYLDLDEFKGINDAMGHDVGDQVLCAVAEVIAQRLRISDVACRLGGDEFAVMLPQTDLAGAKVFFEALHVKLVEMAHSRGWPLGCSIGVSVVDGRPADFDDALGHADALMYLAKRAGKNQVQVGQFQRRA
ncbi:MAG: GGDEF domain-containing protein [Burkholderiaceae bacterium]